MNCRPIISTYFLTIIVLTIPLALLQAFSLLLSFWILAGVFFFFPAIIPNCSIFESRCTRFQTQNHEIWLTIDDGPDPVDTPQILSLLAQHQARATFFVIGNRAQQYPDLIREILRQGHTIGNHTLTHPVKSFWIAFTSRIEREIDDASLALKKIEAESISPFFRAPVGMVNFFLPPLLEKKNLRLIGWSARGYDAVNSNPEIVVSRILKDIFPGAIILIHEGHHPNQSCASHNPQCIDLLLKKLSELQYKCVLPKGEQLIPY